MAGSSSSQSLRQELIVRIRPLFFFGSTGVGLSFLVLLACFGLWVVPSGSSGHSRSLGLLKLSSALDLVQAQRGVVASPPPQLWNQRLGLAPARRLWKRLGSGLWWQGWTSDGQSYLILPSTLFNRSEQAALRATSVDGLLVVSADALHQNQLSQRLQSQTVRPPLPGGLVDACLHRLISSPSVSWQPEALARFSGSVAPLLQQTRFGCVSFRTEGDRLHWHGWGGSREFAASPAKPKVDGAFVAPARSFRTPRAQDKHRAAGPFLKLQGTRLSLLLGPLASRGIIRTPLEQHYGIGRSQLKVLMGAPFELQLVPVDAAGFTSGVQLQLKLPPDPTLLDRSLGMIAGRLMDQGLRSKNKNAEIWFDPAVGDGVVVGGWQLVSLPAGDQQLNVGLGVAPSKEAPTTRGFQLNPGVLLKLQADGKALQERQLLPGRWPRTVQNSNTVEFSLHRLMPDEPNSADWFEIRGQLVLASSDAP